MIAKILSGAVVGLEAVPVEVEVALVKKGLPAFHIVGLPDKAVSEAKERVRSAILHINAEFPSYRITVNLAPADLPKIGPSYDLPIALGILIASEQLEADLSTTIVAGELSLDGQIRHTNGILPLALMAVAHKYKHMYVPKSDAREGAIVKGVSIYGFDSLLSVFGHVTDTKPIKPHRNVSFDSLTTSHAGVFDMADIKGQEQAKRGLEIAAAGGHNTMLKGVPGAGKTMLARAFSSILPMMAEEEALEVTKIYSITGNLPAGESIIKSRPFRAPHHTTSRIGLIGGGSVPMPGEISLAHRGVLFMDELPEFPRSTLESLRQPLEDGIVSIARAAGHVTYPAQFILISAANPCPCGHLGSTRKSCGCMPGQIARYQRKVSGAILDRIDIHLTCPELSPDELSDLPRGESSSVVQKRVENARKFQRTRFKHLNGIQSNAEMSSRDVHALCPLSEECVSLLRSAVSRYTLSARSYHKMIKVSRTIADLDGASAIQKKHVAEALRYRVRSE